MMAILAAILDFYRKLEIVEKRLKLDI